MNNAWVDRWTTMRGEHISRRAFGGITAGALAALGWVVETESKGKKKKKKKKKKPAPTPNSAPYRFVGAFGTPGDSLGQLNRPRDVAVDSQGNVFVADTGNNRIQMFRPRVTNPDQYDAFTAWGVLGSGEGQFNQPSGIAVFGAAVYVVDRDNHRIQKFAPVNGASRFGTESRASRGRSAQRHGRPRKDRARR